MKKIFAIFVLFSFLLGNSVLALPVSGKEKNSKKEEKKVVSIEEIAPEFGFKSPKPGEKLKGEIKIEGAVKNANSVEFYLRQPQSLSPIYLGSGNLVGNFWQLSWNTSLNPNGNYKLSAKISNPYGEYQSKETDVQVENEVKKEPEKEKDLRKEIEEKKEEIKQEDKKIEEKKEEVGKNVEEKIEESKREIEKVVEVKPEVSQKFEETKEKVKEKISEFVEETKKEKELEKNFEKVEEKGKKIEEKITKAKDDLAKIKEVKVKAEEKGLENEKERAEILEKTQSEELKSLSEEKKENQAVAVPLVSQKEEAKKKKEEVKKEILGSASKPAEEVEKITPAEKKEEISKIRNETEKKVLAHLEELEKKVSESQEVKAEKNEVLAKDSDGDGISDEEEIKLGTSSLNPDSDGDGFLDGDEYSMGYDSLKPGPADKIVYQDPKKSKKIKSEIYKVERIEVVKLPEEKIGLKIGGKGLPNSFVTVYVFSSALVMTTKTDENGNWSIVLDKPLTDGFHEVYVGVTNNHGEVTARSEGFLFAKSGEKVVGITLSSIEAKITPPAVALEKGFLFLTLGLIFLAIGIALIIIGILSRRKVKEIT